MLLDSGVQSAQMARLSMLKVISKATARQCPMESKNPRKTPPEEEVHSKVAAPSLLLQSIGDCSSGLLLRF